MSVKRDMAVRPLVILPGGLYLTERDISRIHISHHAKQLGYLLLFVALVFLGSFDGPLP